MEISGAALRQVPALSRAGFRRDSVEAFSSGVSIAAGRGGFEVKISARPRRVSVVGSGGGGEFFDEGHLEYYTSPAKCGGGKEKGKEEKRKARLVEGLSAFYSVGFGVGAGEGVVRDVNRKMISEEAAEAVLAQLNQLRAEEKEMRRKRKEEKKEIKKIRKKEKAAIKAARLKECVDPNASSSSSESSDSDCETVIKMSSLKSTALPDTKLGSLEVPKVALACHKEPLTLELRIEERMEENHILLKSEQECSSSSDISCKSSEIAVERVMGRIEVCMGGKCKKSGALELLEEFERKVGVEGAVVGCKCMGKCRVGPNVRVSNHCADVDSIKPASNPLCIGVGLGDVGAIVAKFFGENTDTGLLSA